MSNEIKMLFYIGSFFVIPLIGGWTIATLKGNKKIAYQWYWGIGFAIGLDVDETQFFIILPGIALWYELKKTGELVTTKKKGNENTDEFTTWND